jgi:hypothetical protein
MFERFFTDAVSNTVVLDDVGVFGDADVLGRLMRSGGPMRTLLHEKTHHASFDSGVGIALAAIAAWAAEATTGPVPAGRLSLSQRDLLLLRSVYPLLEPLLEGLALFAEHDALSLRDDSGALSAVTSTASLVCRVPPDARGLDDLRDVLFYLRSRPDWGDAKAHLLSQPLRARPAYLLGYLAVKRLYWDLLSRCPRLANPDLFVLLMLDYWFRDRALRGRLLYWGAPVTPAAVFGDLAWIVEHLQVRHGQLVEHVDRYLDELLHYLLGDPPDVSPIGSSGGPSYRGAGGATDFMASEFRLAGLRLRTPADLARYRTDFRFSSTPVTFHVDGGRARVTTAAGPVLDDVPAVAQSMRGTFEGTIEGVITPHEGWQVAMILSARDGIVAVRSWAHGGWNPSQLTAYFDQFPSAVEALRVMRALTADWSRTATAPLVARELPRIEEAATEATIGIYSRWAWPRATAAARDAAVAAVSAGGLDAVIGDARLLAVAGRTSAACGCKALRLIDVARTQERGEPALRRDLEAINARLRPIVGLDPFYITGETVSSAV